MDVLGFIYSNSTVVISIVNILLVLFVFIQIRDARKPILVTKIISSNKEVTDKANVLETGTLYLAILNISKNISKSIDIKYRFDFNEHSITVKEPSLSHLNPDEATRFIIKSKKMREKYPELFEEITKKERTWIIPKDTLKINLTVTIRYNPILGILFKYALEDNYIIEWGSLKCYPNIKDHPVFMSWNKRNGEYYIDKLTGNIPNRKKWNHNISLIE